MATISSTLKMFDAFSRPMRNVTQALNITISAMENLQNAADKNTNVARQFDAARNKIAEANAELIKITEDIDKANRNQQRFNESVQNTNNSMMSLAKSAAGVVAAYVGLREVKGFFSDLFSRGIDFNAFRQSSSVAFTTFLGDAEIAQQYMDDMLAFAKKTPFAYPDLLTAGRNMIAFGMEADKTFPVVKAIGDATAAIGGNSQKLTEIANVFGSIQVAGRLSMDEVNRLHTNGIQALEMLAEKFNVTGSQMKKMISSGAVGADAAIAILVDGINERFDGMMEKLKGTWAGTIDSFSSARRNAGAELMEMFMDPLMNLIGSVTGFFRRLPTLISPGINAFLPLTAIITTAFETSKIDTFFSVFNVGLEITAFLLTGLVQSLLWLWDVIVLGTNMAVDAFYNFGVIIAGISPFILGVVAAWLAYNLIVNHATVGTKIFIAVQGLLTRTMVIAHGIITGVTTAVRLLNLAFRANPIGFVISLVIGLISAILALQYVTNGIKEIFSDAFGFVMDVAENAVNFIISTLNGAIKAINSVSNFFAGLLGVDAKQIQELEFHADFSRVKASGQDFIRNFSLEDIKSKFSLNYEAPEVPELMDPSSYSVAGGGMLPTELDKVGEVGKIRDTVDISSEDLKLMRELAEMSAIQNFVTLQPQLTFGDTHVKQDGRTVDEIIANINERLTEEIASSAKGVLHVG